MSQLYKDDIFEEGNIRMESISEKLGIIQAEYEEALREGDLISQYEILRFVQNHVDLYPAIAKAESHLLSETPQIALDLEAIEANLHSGVRLSQALTVWERVVRKFEPIIRLFFCFWPAIAMVLFSWVTHRLLSRPITVKLFRELLFLDYLIFGSVVVLCASRLWRSGWRVSHSGPKSLPKRFTKPDILLFSKGALIGALVVAVLPLFVWTGKSLFQPQSPHMYAVMRETGKFDVRGKYELIVRLGQTEARYLILASAGDDLPLAVSLYDDKDRLLSRDISQDGEAVIGFRPTAAKAYKIRLEALGSTRPRAERWETKVFQLKEEKPDRKSRG